MMCVRTYLAPSPIHGIGVFAAEDIPAHTMTWTYTPEFDLALTFEQIRSQPPIIFEFMLRYLYVPKSIPGVYILCADNGRFINHSDTPNVAIDAQESDWSVRLIRKGEEITCNYNTDFGDDPIFGAAIPSKRSSF